MIALVFYLSSLVSQPSPSHCEEYGRRLDGTYVTVCDGRVVRVRDGAGNSRIWERTTDTVAVQSRGKAPMILGFDGR